ncbi:Trehalose phosphorylase [Mycena indigotica]|uniref:Trehalose phosphorylase n=1 Tax=Mycena indigotica TaxID=2126181 RepID=A0A8H6VX27_9AGAR|nr:Trehalose phosphorylase [Mycena indigotica]KAF7295051.1 Trehalose phosphorylase [Mycena indigotica]
MSVQHQFQSLPSAAVRRRLSSVVQEKPNMVAPFSSLTPMWLGLAGSAIDQSKFQLALAIHDGVYSTDFTSAIVEVGKNKANDIETFVLQTIRKFSSEHLCKFLGAGVTTTLLKSAPNLATRLWLECDIVPIIFNIKPYHTDSVTSINIKHRISSTTGSYVPSGAETPTLFVEASHLDQAQLGAAGTSGRLPIPRTLDEQADSAVRKCLMYYGPNNSPRLTIGPRNQVTVDAAGKIHLIDDLDKYKETVRPGTWNAVIKLADELREKKIKIGFFSSTPQGGGVALMRHALIRFLTLLDVDAAWYVPNPSPAVFRITKDNHNRLQGVAAPESRLTQADKEKFDEWIAKNTLRWTAEGGPLAPGGVDIAFIDDPQMPGSIPIIKKVRPDLPIVYRSHIEIRSDLVHISGSPQEEVWDYLWNNIKLADLFISHPVNKFVPDDVPIEKVALLGAATDWLDGLNKDLDPLSSAYYMGIFRDLCTTQKMHQLQWPAREYIVQVARFDPAKGIPHVIDSYSKFRKLLRKSQSELTEEEHPQLLICGHGAVDDPDASIIYDEVTQLIASEAYREFAHDIVVMRLPPSDQLLNALMANARIALQLSTREGFEVKVSEAIHTGIPIIASQTGGIPLQVEHGKSGYLTPPGAEGTDAVAKHLYDLYTDEQLYRNMSQYAKTHVSDEVGTVGNAAAWLYLAVMYSRGIKIQPKGAWLNDMLRAETNEPYVDGEPRLPRAPIQMQ